MPTVFTGGIAASRFQPFIAMRTKERIELAGVDFSLRASNATFLVDESLKLASVDD
jgi:hypothetical protein